MKFLDYSKKQRMINSKNTSYILFTLVVFLIFFGLNILLASSSFLARQEFGDPYFYLKKQAIFAIVGIFILITISRIPYSLWKKFAWAFYIISIILLLMVFLPGVGKKAGGAYRWINLGIFSMQPSDLVKISLILVLSRLYANDSFQGIKKILITMGIIALPVFLISSEPDFSTSMHILFSVFLFLFLTDFPISIMFLLSLSSLPVVYYGIIQVPYRWDRIKAFIDPYKYRFEGAYQLVASFKSFAAGGLFGQGLGEGIRRHNLSARHTDFILSVLAEDLGFSGIFITFIIYFSVILYSIYKLSFVTDPFGRLLGSGIVLLFGIQVAMNISVTMGLMPTTGINMPFMSYGGTSLVVYSSMFGILLNILRENNTF